jgi:hypothetical protein
VAEWVLRWVGRDSELRPPKLGTESSAELTQIGDVRSRRSCAVRLGAAIPAPRQCECVEAPARSVGGQYGDPSGA